MEEDKQITEENKKRILQSQDEMIEQEQDLEQENNCEHFTGEVIKQVDEEMKKMENQNEEQGEGKEAAEKANATKEEKAADIISKEVENLSGISQDIKDGFNVGQRAEGTKEGKHLVQGFLDGCSSSGIQFYVLVYLVGLLIYSSKNMAELEEGLNATEEDIKDLDRTLDKIADNVCTFKDKDLLSEEKLTLKLDATSQEIQTINNKVIKMTNNISKLHSKEYEKKEYNKKLNSTQDKLSNEAARMLIKKCKERGVIAHINGKDEIVLEERKENAENRIRTAKGIKSVENMAIKEMASLKAYDENLYRNIAAYKNDPTKWNYEYEKGQREIKEFSYDKSFDDIRNLDDMYKDISLGFGNISEGKQNQIYSSLKDASLTRMGNSLISKGLEVTKTENGLTVKETSETYNTRIKNLEEKGELKDNSLPEEEMTLEKKY